MIVRPDATVKGGDRVNVAIVEKDSSVLSVSDAQADENGMHVEFRVTISAASGEDVAVDYTTSEGTAEAGKDYTSATGTLSFAANSTSSQTIRVPVIDDKVDEDEEETFTLTLSNAQGASLAGGGSTLSVTGTITDDDVPQVTVSFEQGSYTVAEGSSVEVKVTLDVEPERTVTVPLTATNQAGASSADYSGVPADVTFASGETEQTFTFSAASDDVDDDGESVKLGFGSSLPDGVSKGSTNEATVSITDDDVPQVTVSFEQGSYTTVEGASNGVSVTLVLSGALEGAVEIPIKELTQSTAASGDYTGVPESVTFAKGETSAQFQIQATLDTEDEDVEEVVLGFGPLPDGTATGNISQATVTITDSVRVSFASSSYEATEGGADAEVTVRLSDPAPWDIAVPLTAEGRNGADAGDWSGVPQELAFTTGQTSRSFTVTAVDDLVEDDDEMVELGFGLLPDGLIAVPPATAVLTIMNQEDQPAQNDCDAIWCATLTLADNVSAEKGRHSYQWNGWLPHTTPNSSLSDTDFTYKGTEYVVSEIYTRVNVDFPFDSIFSIDFTAPGSSVSVAVPESHLREWTMHIDELALPFPPGGSVIFKHPKFNTFTDPATFQLRITASELTEEEPGPPPAPRYPFYHSWSHPPENPEIWWFEVIWQYPFLDYAQDLAFRQAGKAPVTGYKVQWKKAGGSWNNPADVSEMVLDIAWLALILNVLPDVEYMVRVIAFNDFGDSPPSVELAVTPWRETGPPMMATATVDGGTLTIAYSEALDEGSAPEADNFKVTVGDHVRGVSGVAVAGSAVTLTLASPVTQQDEVKLSYNGPRRNDYIPGFEEVPITYEYKPRIQDLVGNDAKFFNDRPVTNNTPATANSTREARQNTPATGAPAISGTPLAGQTLTVSTSSIERMRMA